MSEARSESAPTKKPLSVIKFIEFALSITCTVLHYYSFRDGDMVTGFLATGTFCGYVVILTTIMTGETERKEKIYSIYIENIFRISHKDSATQTNGSFLQLTWMCSVCYIWCFHYRCMGGRLSNTDQRPGHLKRGICHYEWRCIFYGRNIQVQNKVNKLIVNS
jgi:hypothetical protein